MSVNDKADSLQSLYSKFSSIYEKASGEAGSLENQMKRLMGYSGKSNPFSSIYKEGADSLKDFKKTHQASFRSAEKDVIHYNKVFQKNIVQAF